MDNKFWIAQSLTPATDLDSSEWGLESARDSKHTGNSTAIYILLALFCGWVFGMLAMVALIE